MTPDPFENWPTEPHEFPDKIVLPICGVILLFAAWWYGYFDPIIRFFQ